MEIMIFDGEKYNNQTYASTIILNFKAKYWYLCFRSATNLIIIDDTKKEFTNYLKSELCGEY